MRRALIILVLAILLHNRAIPSASAQIEGRIIRVGLFAGSQPLVRSGCWSFVEADLRWQGDKPFDGELRVEQLDRDGDLVSFVQKIALTPDGEWHRHEIYYVPHNINRTNTATLQVYDSQSRLKKIVNESGQEVTGLVSPAMLELPPDDFLVLDLTNPGRLPHLNWLDSDRVGKGQWLNARKVRAISPRELPRQGRGLEMVDALVWNNADPSELSQQQIEALADWTENGGRMLLTAGTSWQALSKSTLAELLPVKILGTDEVREVQEFMDLIRNESYSLDLARIHYKHPFPRCQMQPLPIALPIPADCANPQIAYRRFMGRGEVIFVGASLKDLLPVPTEVEIPTGETDSQEPKPLPPAPFTRACEEVLGQHLLSLPQVREATVSNWGVFEPRDLFSNVRRFVGFESLSAAFVISAILFAVAYTFIATIGSYWYLNRRSWRHLNWMAFAVISIVGSILGTAMVWSLRGIRTQVWQATVVDAHSGMDRANASCLFGIKTPNHAQLSLRLPQDPGDDLRHAQYGPLRATPESTDQNAADSTFVAAEEYFSTLNGEEIINVPFRATLKEFQGQWQGSLGGGLEAKLVARRADDPRLFYYEFGPGSYIRNNLGVNLRECYLLETRDEYAMDASRIGCLYLGSLPKSGVGATLTGEQIRERLYFLPKSPTTPDPEPKRIERYPYLEAYLKPWCYRAGVSYWGQEETKVSLAPIAVDREYYSLLLLSVYDLIAPDPQQKQMTCRRTYGRTLGATHWLSPHTAVLIGWSDDPPPANLEINRQRYRPSKSGTMYRIVIPVERPSRKYST